jgi:peptide/nickel transport system substrate-binding protein
MELYDDLKATNDQTRRDEMMKRILQISKEYFYHIGTSLIAPTYAVVKNTLRNVPESMPSSFIFSTPVSVNPQQRYFSE